MGPTLITCLLVITFFMGCSTRPAYFDHGLDGSGESCFDTFIASRGMKDIDLNDLSLERFLDDFGDIIYVTDPDLSFTIGYRVSPNEEKMGIIYFRFEKLDRTYFMVDWYCQKDGLPHK